MPFWLKASLLYAALAISILAVAGADWRTGLDLLVLALGVLPEVVRRSPAMYLRLMRLRYRITNAETNWNLSVRFSGQFSTDRVATFLRTESARTPDHLRLIQATDVRFIFQYRRLFTTELLLGSDFSLGSRSASDPDFSNMELTVFDQAVSYRRSEKVLEQDLIPLLESIRNTLNPTSALYSLRVRFEDVNPFFSLYMKQLRRELIDDFRFEFHLPASEPREYVRVDRQDMVVVAHSAERFRRAVRAGLTFSAAAG